LCFPLDLKCTSQSVDLVGLSVSTPKPAVGLPNWKKPNWRMNSWRTCGFW